MNFGSSHSSQSPVIASAAITPQQRTQLFPQVGNLLGFNWSQTGTTPLVTSYVPSYNNYSSGFNFGGPKKQQITTGGEPIYSFTPKDVTQNFAQIPMEGINHYLNMYSNAINNPYTPTTAENQLLSNIMNQTSAQFANRGLGESPIAASTVGASIAPSLINMRQAALNNIMSGLGGEINTGQQLLTQRGQDINAALTQRQSQLQGLLAFLEMMGFQKNLGQTGSSSGFNFGIASSGGGGGGGGSAPGGGAG